MLRRASPELEERRRGVWGGAPRNNETRRTITPAAGTGRLAGHRGELPAGRRVPLYDLQRRPWRADRTRRRLDTRRSRAASDRESDALSRPDAQVFDGMIAGIDKPISEITCVGVLQRESLRRSGRQTSPDRARSLGGASEVTDLAARGPWKASQRGPATVAGIRDAGTSTQVHPESSALGVMH